MTRVRHRFTNSSNNNGTERFNNEKMDNSDKNGWQNQDSPS